MKIDKIREMDPRGALAVLHQPLNKIKMTLPVTGSLPRTPIPLLTNPGTQQLYAHGHAAHALRLCLARVSDLAKHSVSKFSFQLKFSDSK